MYKALELGILENCVMYFFLNIVLICYSSFHYNHEILKVVLRNKISKQHQYWIWGRPSWLKHLVINGATTTGKEEKGQDKKTEKEARF